MKLEKTFAVFAMLAVFFVGISHTSFTQEKPPEKPDVLIVYSSGTPSITNGDVKPEDYDAVTTPTPKDENMHTVAIKLGTALRERNLTVRVAKTSEIRSRDEILSAKLVIIGSPSYFGNVSWQVKKFTDEIFHKIYASGKKRLGGKTIAAFSMAGIEPSARQTLDAIKRAVNDCKGTFGPTMIVLTKHSKQEINNSIKQFAGKITDELKQ